MKFRFMNKGGNLMLTIDVLQDENRLVKEIDRHAQDLRIDVSAYKEKVLRMMSPDFTREERVNLLIKTALENIDESEPDWTYLAARMYLQELYTQAGINRNYDAAVRPYGSFYELVQLLTEKGLYADLLLNKYTKEEIEACGRLINQDRDDLFNYLGLHTLATRYLARDHSQNTYEVPQERWLVIEMNIMQDEDPSRRLDYVEEAYWALSNLYMTVATPTLNNAGKSHGQLSSCFIDTVDDSLQAIYDSNTDIAKLSKNGGGIGVYMGKVRS